jgi:hypothetical protein
VLTPTNCETHEQHTTLPFPDNVNLRRCERGAALSAPQCVTALGLGCKTPRCPRSHVRPKALPSAWRPACGHRAGSWRWERRKIDMSKTENLVRDAMAAVCIPRAQMPNRNSPERNARPTTLRRASKANQSTLHAVLTPPPRGPPGDPHVLPRTSGTNGARSHTKEGSADAASALGPRNESKLGVRHERHAPSTVGGLVNSNLGELVNSNQEGSY